MSIYPVLNTALGSYRENKNDKFFSPMESEYNSAGTQVIYIKQIYTK